MSNLHECWVSVHYRPLCVEYTGKLLGLEHSLMTTPICGQTTRPMNTSPQFALREGKPSYLVLEKNPSHQREADGSMEERCECSRNGLILQLQVSPGRLKRQGWTIHEFASRCLTEPHVLEWDSVHRTSLWLPDLLTLLH